ncbi:MAG TPA: hypothetical protein VFF17_15540 [Thermoanaerobaculia bacterium]|nr:hypothetical protein [Thermoanaerobaculia bacterium]
MARRGPARFWLLVAAVLAASAAFGIHPEPQSAIPDGALEVSTVSVESSGVSHDCLACRAHRPLVSAPAPLVIAAPERTAVRHALARSIALRSIPLPPSVGRAPPVSA